MLFPRDHRFHCGRGLASHFQADAEEAEQTYSLAAPVLANNMDAVFSSSGQGFSLEAGFGCGSLFMREAWRPVAVCAPSQATTDPLWSPGSRGIGDVRHLRRTKLHPLTT